MPYKNLRDSQPTSLLTELPPLQMGQADLQADFQRYYNHTLGRDKHCTLTHYYYEALALTLRDRLMQRWKKTRDAHRESQCRRAYYISLEFLIGRSLGNAMLNMDAIPTTTAALQALGIKLEELVEQEHDAGLGNGGLGRLAACFLDSCATLQLPVMGYGIRYEYGMFRQIMIDHNQVEEPDHWLLNGNPWEIERPEHTQRIRYGGHTEHIQGVNGKPKVRWVNTHDVLAVPYDMPIPGYRNGTVNTLRLWSAAATDEFDLDDFNAGSYSESVAAKNDAEKITMVLYPNDTSESGKELRLRQQYFLASASLQDVFRRWSRDQGENFAQFAEKNCFQLNDTHPSIAVPELMRLLIDEHDLKWEQAWEITTQCMAYTNHTLLPEALEKWPVRLFAHLLPRLLDIIYEINARFLTTIAQRWPGDNERINRMSLIEEGPEQQVRMAYLAIVGSFSVNGVAALHSQLLTEGLFHDFYELWPQKFNNKTNGVTQRRWLAWCNPKLSELITQTIGDGWTAELTQLKQLEPYLDDNRFCQAWQAIKKTNKIRLANLVKQECGITFNPDAMFDVQVKRMHEYKRQLLNALHIIHLYNRIKRGDTDHWTPRCVLIGGKAAPGYYMAKQVIRLISQMAHCINHDPHVGELLKVVFFPNYRVSAMEVICPATDLSEQISTAGKEASGTGNMKFMINGSLTIGTLDGANIEIREAVGAENFFLFGLDAQQVEATKAHYNPNHIIAHDADLRQVMDLLESGHFTFDAHETIATITHAIRNPHDPWLVAADFRSYVDAQQQAATTYQDQTQWTRMSILNSANSGYFSTDRTMQEYNSDIWKLTPCLVTN